MDEQVGVEQLDRDPCIESRLEIRARACGAVAGDQQRGAKPLAPAEAEISERPHHLHHLGVLRMGGVELGVEKPREPGIDFRAHCFDERQKRIRP